MKKLILFFAVFCCAKANAQVYQEMPQYGYRANRMSFDSTLQIPTVCGVPTLKSVQFVTKKAAIAYDSCNAVFYTYSPKTQTWSAVSGGGGSTDTTSLSNRINLKLNIADTSSMLSKYLRKTDTASLSNRIEQRIDSLRRSNDSIFARKNGTFVFQYKDSVGGGAFLPLSGGTLTGNLNGTTGTFTSSGSSNTFNINHSSGSGHALEITKAGNGEGIIVNKTSGSGNAVTITGTLNATNIVKNGGTSSQFLKADGSVDSTTYVSDTTALQRKSLSANTIMANNTDTTANATAQSFKDTSGTYNGTITFTGTTAPSGATNHSFRLTQLGKCVTLHIALVFATNGAGLTAVQMTLPAGAPTPIQPAGLTAASTNMYPITANIVSSTNQSILSNAVRGFLRNNTAANGFEIFINFSSSAPGQVGVTLQYWTN